MKILKLEKVTLQNAFPDVTPVTLRCFWLNLYCARAQTAISKLAVKF